MIVPKEWNELRFVEKLYYKDFYDMWAGSCELSVHMYYHLESNTHYGSPWTDAGGWGSPRNTFWPESHTTYSVSDNGTIRNVVKFDLEETSRGILYIECDPVEDQNPLVFMSKKRSV